MNECATCHNNGGWLVNPDWPMGDCGDRDWHHCPDCDSPWQVEKLWREHLIAYNAERFSAARLERG
jgi:hypothetical protein